MLNKKKEEEEKELELEKLKNEDKRQETNKKKTPHFSLYNLTQSHKLNYFFFSLLLSSLSFSINLLFFGCYLKYLKRREIKCCKIKIRHKINRKNKTREPRRRRKFVFFFFLNSSDFVKV